MKKISGTKEWASHNANCIIGCKHNCKFCYAAFDAVKRFKRVKEGKWEFPVIRWEHIHKKQPKYKGVVMFPTAHDISPDVLGPCIDFLMELLKAGNDVLLVSKPHLICIQEICKAVSGYKDKILFRFTIGSTNNEILKYWEPGAPSFEERLASLKFAFEAGFKTSVSMEPCLDVPHAKETFKTLEPYVTDSIWIGMLNKIDKRVEIKTEEDKKQVEKIKAEQNEEKIRALYENMKNEPKVKWKESIKSVVGLTLATEAGMDI